MSSISEPPKKKQRLCDVESLEMKNQHKSYKISLKIHTKLGDSEKIFEINNLQKIAYFASQLSGRWCTDNNILNINCDSLYFGVDEVESLIFFKKHGKIDIKYPCNRLIYLCNALNYFTEIIQSNTFETYFSECIPAIQYQNLIQLKSLCHQEECDILSAAIDQTTRQISIRQKTINNKIIESWKLVPIQLITSNSAIATAVFTKHFVFSKNRFSNESGLEFAELRDANDLNILWDYIMFNKLYLHNPAIIEVVYQLKPRSNSGYRSSHIVDSKTSFIISQIVTDTLQICLENNLKYKTESTYTMIVNIFDIMNTERNEFEKITDIPDIDRVKVAKQIFFNYDFLFNILKKVVDLNRMDGEKFKTHFGNGLIVQFWMEKLQNIAPIAKYREIIKDFEELKVSETFTKTEQYQLFKTLLCCGYNCLKLNEESLKKILLALIVIVKELPTNQYQCRYQVLETILNDKRKIERIVTKDFLKNVLKCLIEIDYTQSFKLAHAWFPIFMNTHQNWIIKELPAQTSLKTLSTLIEGICECITRNEGVANSFMDSCYFEFINKYTNVWDSV